MTGLLPALALLLPPAWGQTGPKPRIAVVIDDFGLTYPKNVPDARWMAVPWPITFAVMPESPRTAEAARRTKEAGHELIVHFPFDPFLSLELPKERLSASDAEKVKQLLEKSLKAIPGAAGLNNHRSYKATANRPLMREFMRMLKPAGMYFVDSKVSPRSVAYAEARAAGIKAAQNFIFLEEPGHYNDKAFAVRMLGVAASRARRTGEVVVIGHHYFRGTYEALTQEEPKLAAEGFEFVFASALAK